MITYSIWTSGKIVANFYLGKGYDPVKASKILAARFSVKG